MRTYYNIYKGDHNGNFIESMGDVYNFDEVDTAIETFKINYPQCNFYYKKITESDIHSGFGRDPDLH